MITGLPEKSESPEPSGIKIELVVQCRNLTEGLVYLGNQS